MKTFLLSILILNPLSLLAAEINVPAGKLIVKYMKVKAVCKARIYPNDDIVAKLYYHKSDFAKIKREEAKGLTNKGLLSGKGKVCTGDDHPNAMNTIELAEKPEAGDYEEVTIKLTNYDSLVERLRKANKEANSLAAEEL